jgi:hypothetical protein
MLLRIVSVLGGFLIFIFLSFCCEYSIKLFLRRNPQGEGSCGIFFLYDLTVFTTTRTHFIIHITLTTTTIGNVNHNHLFHLSLSFLCLYIMHFPCQSPKNIFWIVSLVFSMVYDFLSLRRDSWHCSILPHTVAFCTAFCYTTFGVAISRCHIRTYDEFCPPPSS